MPTLSRRDWLRLSAAASSASLLSSFHRQGWSAETPAKFSPAKDLIVRSEDPPNAEPALAELIKHNITPVEHFYVRSHAASPKIDAGSFRLRIEGLVNRPAELALGQIKEKFKPRTVEATLTCAGNRRREMSEIKPVGGVQWDAGAIGNAHWTGATLAEVLKSVEPKPEARHVWFEGLDSIKEEDGSVAPFGGSIPLDRALGEIGDVPGALVAFAMNEQPLLPDHGFPVRTVVPGYIGARSVKWLGKITLSDRPSPNHFLAGAYKLVQTATDEAFAAADPIYQFPINAAICTPAAGARLKAGKTTIAGYALPPGDGATGIDKVEVSADGGRTWKTAALTNRSARCCWRLWKIDLALPAGKHQLVVRATDSRGNVQPQKTEWNAKGYLYNAWHRCPVEVG